MSLRLPLSAAVLTAACVVAGTGSPAAFAAPTGSFADLATAFADPSTVGGEITLSADLDQGAAADLVLAAGQSLTLDLNGFDLTTDVVKLTSGSSLTITDTSTGTPGTLAAHWTSGPQLWNRPEAAIDIADAALTIEGRAHVTADGGNPQYVVVSGIGVTSGTGEVTIGGEAVVTAQSKVSGIVVGGASRFNEDIPVSTLTIEDQAQVTGTGVWGAGIGGGMGQDGGILTITDNARVTAQSQAGAGIGGGSEGGNGGTIRIDGDAVVDADSVPSALGGLGAGAGIGGGMALQRDAGAWFSGGNGGDVTIGGNAAVTATSQRLGAGIGAGAHASHGGTLHVTDDATVTATSGLGGAGIGGSNSSLSNGGDVVLDGGTTTAINLGDLESSAVGTGHRNTDFGSLEVNSPAVLVIPDPAELRIPEGITVTGDGEIRGDGNVVNDGAVQLPTENLDWEDLSFAPNNYLTTFHANGGEGTAEVRTFATSFNAGARSLPDSPTRTGFDHIGWADTVDGLPATRSSVSFDADTPLTGDRTVYAQWLSGTTTTATVDDRPLIGADVPVAATVAAADPAAGVPVGTAQLFVDDEPVGEQVPVAADGTAALSYPAATAGEHTLRVEYTPTEVIWSASQSPDLGIDVTAGTTGDDGGDDDTGDNTGDSGNSGSTGAGTGTASTGGLAVTGPAAVALWGGLAVLLLGAGTAVVVLARRRTTAGR